MKSGNDDKKHKGEKDQDTKKTGGGLFGKKKTTIPPHRKAPDTDDEGIGVVHEPQ